MARTGDLEFSDLPQVQCLVVNAPSDSIHADDQFHQLNLVLDTGRMRAATQRLATVTTAARMPTVPK